MNKSPFLKMAQGVPKRGRRYGTSRLGRDGPVPNGFGTTSPGTCSNTISIPLAISGSRPGAGWLPGVDFTKGFKTWHKFSIEIRFMVIPIIVLFIAHGSPFQEAVYDGTNS